jgi:hypothetical protein
MFGSQLKKSSKDWTGCRILFAHFSNKPRLWRSITTAESSSNNFFIVVFPESEFFEIGIYIDAVYIQISYKYASGNLAFN